MRPKLRTPRDQQLPFGAAGLAGDLLGVVGGHADRGASDALFAADAVLAACGRHHSASCSGVKRSRLRSAAATSGGTPAARRAALVATGWMRDCLWPVLVLA